MKEVVLVGECVAYDGAILFTVIQHVDNHRQANHENCMANMIRHHVMHEDVVCAVSGGS